MCESNIDCFYLVHAERIDVEKLVVETPWHHRASVLWYMGDATNHLWWLPETLWPNFNNFKKM
jgi:hypothetical protein